MELSKVKAVVTGAGSGMGRAFALGLAREGGSALVLGETGFEDLDRLQAALEEVTDAAGKIIDAVLTREPKEG